MEFTNFYSINWSGNLKTSFFFKIVEVNHWDLEYKNSWFTFFFHCDAVTDGVESPKI